MDSYIFLEKIINIIKPENYTHDQIMSFLKQEIARRPKYGKFLSAYKIHLIKVECDESKYYFTQT